MELSTQVNDWLDTKEFSHQAHCHQTSLNKWLRGNPEFVERYVKYVSTRGGNLGRKPLIHKDGILPYLNGKAITGKKSLHAVTASIRESKIQVAEKAQENYPLELLNDPFIQLRLSQLKTEKELKEIKQEMEKTKQDQENARKEMFMLPQATAEVPEMGFRDKITQRVNAYCRAHNGIYSVCRDKLNEQMYYRYRKNVKLMAKRQGKPVIAVIEELGLLEEAFNLCCKIFPV